MSKKITKEQWAKMSPAAKFANLPEEKQKEILGTGDIADLEYEWDNWWARPNQVIPEEPYYPTHLLLTGRGWGKALATDTMIPTVDGWVSMGQIKVGMQVYNEVGAPVRVLKVHDVFTPEVGNMYRVHFSTRLGQIEPIDCCGDHLWTVLDFKQYMDAYKNTRRWIDADKYLDIEKYNWLSGDGFENVAKTLSTREMSYKVKASKRKDGTGVEGNNWRIGTASAILGRYVEHDESEYVLGALLPTYSADEFPVEMLRSTINQRFEMLQGLCDMFGVVLTEGRRAGQESANYGNGAGPRVQLRNIPWELQDYIVELIKSLGFTARRSVSDTGAIRDSFKAGKHVEFYPSDLNPFRHSTERKKLVLAEKRMKDLFHVISKIEKIEPRPVRCITVEGDSALYLAGRDFIPTHNTRTMSEWVRRQAKNYPGCRIGLLGRTSTDVRDILVQGEALALDTKVPTPNGFTTMGKLKVGDVIYGGNGKECKVTKAYPVLYNRPCYEMDISGQKVIADENHKWNTLTVSQRQYHRKHKNSPIKKKVRTTGEIFKTQHMADGTANHVIEVNPVIGTSKTLSIDPYLLGYWLGDGDSDGARLTVHLNDHSNIFKEIERCGFTHSVDDTRHIRIGVNGGFRGQLRQRGLLGNKHVPEEYFTADLESRLELIRGLMDSDGTALPGGKQEFSNSRTRLIDDMYKLLSSIGVRVARGKVDRTGNAKLIFCTSEPIFKLERKKERIPEATKRHRYRYIKSVNETDSVPVRCIEVDSDDHTFLITDSYIRTHNSGILNVGPEDERPEYKPSQRKLVWPNGSQAISFSAEVPDQLRGQQFHFYACDELASYTQFVGADGLTAFQNMKIATRLGDRPYGVVATTPKRTDVLRDLLADATEGKVRVVRGSTLENDNLSGDYINTIVGQFKGTAVEKQELEGLMLDDFPEGALWTEDMIDPYRWTDSAPPVCSGGVIIAVDPSVSEVPKDECGIVVVGFTNHRALTKRQAYVLEDGSVKAKPEVWAKRVNEMYLKWNASCVVVETNQGRALLDTLLKSVNPGMRIIGVNASQGKKLRAEPVLMPYSQGRVHHYGKLAELETQLTTWEPEHTPKSPDRLDALVHGITACLLKPPPGMPVRQAKSSDVSARRMTLGRGGGLFRTGPRGIQMNRHR